MNIEYSMLTSLIVVFENLIATVLFFLELRITPRNGPITNSYIVFKERQPFGKIQIA